MSYEAVQAFYRTLAESPELAGRYRSLTWGFWLGYRPSKIVAFAAMTGYQFTVEELNAVRLTNRVEKRAMSFSEWVEEEVDYEPTEYPHSPDSFTEFRKRYGREVGELPSGEKSKVADCGSDVLGNHNKG